MSAKKDYYRARPNKSGEHKDEGMRGFASQQGKLDYRNMRQINKI
jgi:hypothetical protein